MRVAYRACPLCDSADLVDVRQVDVKGHPLWRKPLPASILWRACRACGHSFTASYFDAEGLAILFEGANESQMPGKGDVEQLRHRWAPTVERVAAASPWVQPHAYGAWLDVGFGDGGLMMAAAEWGYEPSGVDIRKDVVEAMRVLGFEAYTRDDAISGRFDVVSMFDVLEHTAFPRDEISIAGACLVPNGLLVVSCPNAGCYAWEALGDDNPYWGELEHYHNFSRARLIALLAECGFEFVSYAVSRRWRLGMEIIARKVAP